MSCGQGTDVEVRSDGFSLVKPAMPLPAYVWGKTPGPTVMYAQIAGLEDLECSFCYRKNSVCHSGICEEGHVFGDESQSDEYDSEEGESDEEEEEEEDAVEEGEGSEEDDDAGIAEPEEVAASADGFNSSQCQIC